MSEVRNEQPKVAIKLKPPRNVLRTVLIWFVISLLTLPLVGVIAYANFYPEQWKALTNRNGFPVRDPGGKIETRV